MQGEKARLEGIDTVLFDFDGTLMDTTPIIIRSWQEVYRAVTGSDGDVDEILGTFGEILRESLAKKFPDQDTEELVKIYKSYQQDRFADEVELFPGVEDLLAYLKDAGYKLGLVTSRIKQTSMRALDMFGIKEYFDSIITADDCTKHKPDPEPIMLALEGCGSVPERAVMIGDTVYDMGCARNARVRYVMVDWAPAIDRESLTGENAPDAWIPDMEGMKAILPEKAAGR